MNSAGSHASPVPSVTATSFTRALAPCFFTQLTCYLGSRSLSLPFLPSAAQTFMPSRPRLRSPRSANRCSRRGAASWPARFLANLKRTRTRATEFSSSHRTPPRSARFKFRAVSPSTIRADRKPRSVWRVTARSALHLSNRIRCLYQSDCCFTVSPRPLLTCLHRSRSSVRCQPWSHSRPFSEVSTAATGSPGVACL